MRRFQFIAVLGLAGALFSGMLAPVTAQQGVVIQNNGVDSTDSARGADNVNISQASGMSSSNNGAGVNNEAGQVVRDKERNRRDRRDDAAAGEAAPAETWEEAPAEGEYQAYAPEGEWVESAEAPFDAVASEQTTALDPNLPVQLPNTGMGADDPSNMWVASTLLSLVFGTLYLRSRRINSLAVTRETTR
jgi:LPXTG-motif cell wall-anchored protein